MSEEKKKVSLAENAFKELKPGEKYQPLLSPDKSYPEVTVWSVTIGLIMTIIFSAAAAFLGLKVGQVFEAAIPISIIAVGLSSAFKRKNSIGENVLIQSIGSCSGVIVAGAIFTLPALYILPIGKRGLPETLYLFLSPRNSIKWMIQNWELAPGKARECSTYSARKHLPQVEAGKT